MDICRGLHAGVCPRAVSGQTIIPGETEAMRIEDICYDQGPQQALEALTQDYRRALGGSGPQAGRQQIDDEVSRLEAHTRDTQNIAHLSSPRNGAWDGTKQPISHCITANCCPPATRARTPPCRTSNSTER
jgi:hypothetical protein